VQAPYTLRGFSCIRAARPLSKRVQQDTGAMKNPIYALVMLALAASTSGLVAATPEEEAKQLEAELAALPLQERRFYELGDAAKGAFDKGKFIEARKLALELEKLTPDFKGNWNYGNAIQDANLILGRLALRAGDLDKAKEHLLAAGRSPGSPQMDSFGPNMSLALDLLKSGEKASVLEYFKLCRVFWQLEGGKLDQWTKEVEAGKVPEFGGNLKY
jgi:hypothetical protein